jgi:hypothetical protein
VKLLFFFSHKDMSWDETEKMAYPSSFPYFFLSSIYEVVDEAVLPNNFFKIAQLYLKSCLCSFFF